LQGLCQGEDVEEAHANACQVSFVYFRQHADELPRLLTQVQEFGIILNPIYISFLKETRKEDALQVQPGLSAVVDTDGNYPATIPTSNEPDRATDEAELGTIIKAFGGKDALLAKGITLDSTNVIVKASLPVPAEVDKGILFVNPNTLRGPP
jgi:hypothetical protein